MPVDRIFLAVPPDHGEAEARPADRDVRPAARALGREELRYTLTPVHHPPASVRLLAEKGIALPGHAIAIGAIAGDHRFRPPVAVQILVEIDRRGFRRWRVGAEIGREWGRERGCQYVWTSVVTES